MEQSSREPQTHKAKVVTFGPDVKLIARVRSARHTAGVVLYFSLVFDKKTQPDRVDCILRNAFRGHGSQLYCRRDLSP